MENIIWYLSISIKIKIICIKLFEKMSLSHFCRGPNPLLFQVCSPFVFLSFVTIRVFVFYHSLSFWFLSQFEFWVLSQGTACWVQGQGPEQEAGWASPAHGQEAKKVRCYVIFGVNVWLELWYLEWTFELWYLESAWELYYMEWTNRVSFMY